MTNVCDNCPLRLFNSKHYNFNGVGNPYSGNVIILPEVDYDAYKLKDLSKGQMIKIIEYCLSSTGEVTENIFVTSLLRCNKNISSYPIEEDIIRNCFNHTINEFRKYNFRNVLLLGDTAKFMLSVTNIHNNDNNVFVSKNNKNYVVSYNPLIKYIDYNKFRIFKNDINRWYHSCISNDFSTYNLVRF